VRRSIVWVAAVVLSACAAVPFDRSKIIAEERSFWWGDKYRQGDGVISIRGMMSALETEEPSRPHVERWRRYHVGTVATLVPGAVSMGFGYGEFSRQGGNRAVGLSLLGGGFGLFVTSQVLGEAARSAAHEAVAAHNALIQPAGRASAGSFRVEAPWIVALRDGRGRVAHAAAIAVTF
jgi:hypothetical protein